MVESQQTEFEIKKKKQDYRLFRDGSATEGPADEDPAIPVTLG